MAATAPAARVAALLASVVETLQHRKDAYADDLAAIRLPDTNNERAYYKACDKRRGIKQDIASIG